MDSFKELFVNMLIIIKHFKMLILFLLLLPFGFIIINKQIFIGFLLFIYYLFIYIFVYFIFNTKYAISCKEIPLNTSRIEIYSIFNVFFFIPKAKAFIIFYDILFYFYNKKKTNLYDILVLLSTIIIIFLLRYSLIYYIGVSFLTLYVVSDFIIKFFYLFNLNYEDNLAKYQHIILNCFLDNPFSVGKADELNIIIDNGAVDFNVLKKIKDFWSSVKNPENLIYSYTLDNKIIFIKGNINNHFTYSLRSNKYLDKNITTNFTSSKSIKVKNNNNDVFYIDCKDTYNPNLIGQYRDNSFTPTYQINDSEIVFKKLDSNILMKLNQYSKNAYGCILSNRNDIILSYRNGEFFNDSNMTVEQYCNDYEILSDKLSLLNKFESENKDYLLSNEGSIAYKFVIDVLKGLK